MRDKISIGHEAKTSAVGVKLLFPNSRSRITLCAMRDLSEHDRHALLRIGRRARV